MKYRNKEIFKNIDLFKAVMAILVVAIHTNPIRGVDNDIISVIYKVLTNIAVPYFFMASSFLVFKKIDNDKYEKKLKKLRRHILKLLKLYFIWNLVYFPITIFGFWYHKNSLSVALSTFFKGIVFIGEQFYSWPLWYILASIYIYLILYIFLKFKINTKVINGVLFLIYCIGFIINSKLYIKMSIFSPFFNYIISIFINGRIFLAFGYILAGKIIASKYEERPYCNVLMVIVFLLILVSTIFIRNDIYMNVVYLVISIIVFLLSLNVKINKNINSSKLRFFSQVAYFTHMIFYFIYILLFRKIGYQGIDAFCVTLLLVTLIFNILWSKSIYKKF